jgi:energy-coupling factor transporter ATP-binding protein EcfA2
MALSELIQGGLLPLDLVAMIWLLMDRHASIVVAAGPSGAGKSTLLTALLELLPSTTARVYARGMYETFDFAERSDPATTVILVNEISAHLPIYLWGPGVRRLFELGRAEFQFFATCHAESVEELAYALSAYPLRISAANLGAIDVLIFLKAWRVGTEIRREIDRVVALRGSDETGLEAIALYDRFEVRIDGVARAFRLDAEDLVVFETDLEHRIAELWDRCGN